VSKSHEGRIRLILAEDNYLLREGTASLLNEIDDVELVAVAEDYDSLIAAVESTPADAVLTDIRMPPTHSDEGIRAAKWIREHHPSVSVVLLSQYVEYEYVRELLEGGTSSIGYLLKERVSDVDDLVSTLRTVCAGGVTLDPRVVEALLRQRTTATSALDSLTPKEREVLEQMAQGKTNAATAEALYMSERSVERHINSIFVKLGLSEEKDTHRRVKAVLTFLEAGQQTGG
jgi:DNA-binding NarL/FixJ family response regulator